MTTLPPPPQRVLLLGATGTIGRATAAALVRRGHAVAALVRRSAPDDGASSGGQAFAARLGLPTEVDCRPGDVRDLGSVTRDGLRGERFDAVVSCLASRTGRPADAWAIDHLAHRHALQAARAAGVGRFVQLSALCLQKPRLAFQHAKLAFEAELQASGLSHAIVRPTAFFKSLSGQVARVQAGKPFMVFGDGTLTACKPIADEDLADFLVDAVEDPQAHHGVLPVGGPGPALTPLQQARLLEELLGRPVPIRRVPVALMDAVIGVLGTAGWFSATLADKAEFARIGRYYATESMLVWDATAQRYDAEATPSYGTRTLRAHYARLLTGQAQAGLGEHAAF